MNKPIQFMALVFGMAVVSMPTLARAQNVGVAVIGPGTLVAKGAGVDVSTQLTCASPPFSLSSSGAVSVSLTERVGSKVTTGSGGLTSLVPITCNNSPQPFEFIVTSNNGRYDKGEAIAQASAQVCSEFICQFQQQTILIQLVK
jgi:hypothetical protein